MSGDSWNKYYFEKYIITFQINLLQKILISKKIVKIKIFSFGN